MKAVVPAAMIILFIIGVLLYVTVPLMLMAIKKPKKKGVSGHRTQSEQWHLYNTKRQPQYSNHSSQHHYSVVTKRDQRLADIENMAIDTIKDFVERGMMTPAEASQALMDAGVGGVTIEPKEEAPEKDDVCPQCQATVAMPDDDYICEDCRSKVGA